MRCIILIDYMIQFFHADDEYYSYVSRVLQSKLRQDVASSSPINLSSSQGILSSLDTLWGFFAPLSTSYYLMARSGKPYTYIQTDKGFSLAFLKFGEILCIAVNGDGSETELEMLRKMYILNAITKLFVGPVVDSLCPEDSFTRTKLWTLMGQCIDAWSNLYKYSPSIAVEALERVSVKEEIIIQAKELIDKCGTTLKSSCIPPVIQSLLFVDSKLLLNISNSDIVLKSQAYILLSILVRARFPPTYTVSISELPEIDTANPVYYKDRLFLPTSVAQFTPLIAYSIQVGEGLTLLLLAKNADHLLCNHLADAILGLNSILAQSSSSKKSMRTNPIPSIDASVKKASEIWSKLNFSSGAEQFHRYCNNILENWNKAKLENLNTTLEEKKQCTTRQEQFISNVYKETQKIFSILYLGKIEKAAEETSAIVTICTSMKINFSDDYSSFLRVKGDRNETPGISLHEYNNLLYYMFINRLTDAYNGFAFCPRDSSLGVTYIDDLAKAKGQKSGIMLHNYLLRMIDRVQRFILNGCSIQIWKQESFVCSYHVWVCNQKNGIRIPFHQQLFSESVPPGIFADPSAYRKYGKDGVILELYLMHKAETSTQIVMKNSDIICDRLWLLSRETSPRFTTFL